MQDLQLSGVWAIGLEGGKCFPLPDSNPHLCTYWHGSTLFNRLAEQHLQLLFDPKSTVARCVRQFLSSPKIAHEPQNPQAQRTLNLRPKALNTKPPDHILKPQRRGFAQEPYKSLISIITRIISPYCPYPKTEPL